MHPAPDALPVIMDVVGASSLDERAARQRTIESTFTDVASRLPALYER